METQNIITYSWGEFYEAAKACDNYEEIKGKFAVFEALDEAKTEKEISNIVKPLSREQINWLNSPCLDGLVTYAESIAYNTACMLPFPETCKYLLTKNIIRIEMYHITECCISNRFQTLKMLLEYRQVPHFFERTLYLACESNYAKIVELILDFDILYDEVFSHKKFTISSRPNILHNALCKASERGLVETINLLLRRGADIHTHYDEPLFLAVQHKHINAVKLLIEKGADVNAYRGRTLEAAIDRHDINIVRLLLDNGADIHAGNNIALVAAVQCEEIEIIKLLLERGASMKEMDGYFTRKIETVKLILGMQ